MPVSRLAWLVGVAVLVLVVNVAVSVLYMVVLRPHPLWLEMEDKNIATLHLICGLPCSGKTTLAKHIEKERSALRLTPDEWITRLFGDDLSVKALDSARDPVEAALWEVAARVLVLGLDVVLDFGFWSSSEREEFRARAKQLGAGSELHFLDVPEEVLVERLAARNAQLPPGTFWIDEGRLRDWASQFEPPTEEELRPREASLSAL